MVNPGNGIAPGACLSLNRAVATSVHAARIPFYWTSLQVNVNTRAEWHCDEHNVGLSVMLVAGDFTGGEFAIGSSDTLQLKGQCVLFCGKDWHCSLPFSGKRLSVVAFTHTLCRESTEVDRAHLRALGFPLPKFLRRARVHGARTRVAARTPLGCARSGTRGISCT